MAGPIRRRLPPGAVIAANEWLLLGGVALLLVAHNALVIGVLLGAAEFATPASNALVAGSRTMITPDRLQGRVAAISAMIAMSLGWFGPLAVGFAFQHSGATATILMVAAWSLMLALTATALPTLRAGPPLRAPTPEL